MPTAFDVADLRHRSRWLAFRRVLRAAMVAALAFAACACTSDDSTSTPDVSSSVTSQIAADALFKADLNQNRPQEGTRSINARLTNISDQPLHVTSVELESDKFAAPDGPTPKDSTFAPGQTIDLVVDYGDPTCDGDVTSLAYQVTLDDGTTYTVPVNHHGVAWIGRLYDRDCAIRSIESIASIEYGTFARERVAGNLVLAGDLVLTPQPDAAPSDTFTVKEVFGSVLINFAPRTASTLPHVYKAGDGVVRLPVTMSAFRCDPHARGESTQTFLLSVYLVPLDGPEVRLILPPGKGLQHQVLSLIDDVCAEPHGDGTAI